MARRSATRSPRRSFRRLKFLQYLNRLLAESFEDMLGCPDMLSVEMGILFLVVLALLAGILGIPWVVFRR